MDSKKALDGVAAQPLDVYEQTRMALHDLVAELCEAMDEDTTDVYKRKGYEMIGTYYREPVNTGELMLTLSSVLEDILYKLELTQESEQVTMVRDEYSMMKKDEE